MAFTFSYFFFDCGKIARLKSSWEKLPAKSNQDYEKLLVASDMSHNYKHYREALKECKPPAIPYLGLFPKDLIAVEEGNENRTPEVLPTLILLS